MLITFNKNIIDFLKINENHKVTTNPLTSTDIDRTLYLIDKIVTYGDAEIKTDDTLFNSILYIHSKLFYYLKNKEMDINEEEYEKVKINLINEMNKYICFVKINHKSSVRDQFTRSLVNQAFMNIIGNISRADNHPCDNMQKFNKALNFNATVDDKPTYLPLVNIVSLIINNLHEKDSLNNINDYLNNPYIKSGLSSNFRELAKLAKKEKHYAYEMYNSFMLTIDALIYSSIDYYEINPDVIKY